ncbi:abscisic acid-deficient protein Aba4 family protein [Wenzhouxiangella sp. XN24]|uniref:abscisic acid-deficient protein Aba4 family protein n=1 Tax=Wenzhouxiangella sp. XN24 TaxID=2713569 RepID=UPI0013E9C3DE|nr:abscisic acid-deficient protein Aba4 family protein [Wenzhouxiangella sp. XN24]NGX17568.1 DUF4281 domain-containing protein [Wenzhouxiangella sp. XN24]
MWPFEAGATFGAAGQLMTGLWVLLLVSLWVSRLASAVKWIGFFGLPLLFGLAYVLLIFPHVPFQDGGFGSLGAVRGLFGSDQILLAGWLHFLVFDYFIGCWIAGQQRSERLPRSLVALSLVFCFLAGPAGLLLYLLIRTVCRWRNGRAWWRACVP